MPSRRIAPLLLTVTLFAQGPDFTPPTPLFRAAFHNDTAEAKRLLALGADPNEGRLIGFTPVFFPIFHHNPELFRAMVAKGADVKALDAYGSTTLMWAASDEAGRDELVIELLRLGVDPSVKNKYGETAMTWALRRGQTPVVTALARAGQDPNARLRPAVESAIALLQKSGEQFVRVSGCASCHHQSVPQMAIGAARPRGFSVSPEASERQVAAVLATYRAAVEIMQKGTERIPDPAIGVSYALVGLAAEGHHRDEITAAMAHHVASAQKPDGRFWSTPARPPIESSDITATALSIRALDAYGKDPEAAITKAREWLSRTTAQTTEEHSMKLLGLAWSRASQALRAKAARPLLMQQRPDGGWSQTSALESDAYATGQALVALHESGQLRPQDNAYERGVAYLLRTQFPDGSWHVRSRAFPFQPLKDSGFPHGRDQWISASATGWAAMAMAYAAPVTPPAASARLHR